MDGMTTCYNHFPVPQFYDIPLMLPDYTSMIPNIFTPPLLPVTVLSPQIITPVLCPYASTLVPEVVVPIVPTAGVEVTSGIYNDLYNHLYEHEFHYVENYPPSTTISTETLSDNVLYLEEEVTDQPEVEVDEEMDDSEDAVQNGNPIDLYLSLPKELFPTTRMLSIDPNAIIDEFCKLASMRENVAWILDLEFGVPRVPVTRAIAAYDVKYNSIHCKNTPGAIHPGFEKCNSEFKRIILFYYDCIVSNWYNGYIALNSDKSVENFQSWLQIPMQIFGMCWP